MRTYTATLNGVVIATATTETNLYFRINTYCINNNMIFSSVCLDVEIGCTEH